MGPKKVARDDKHGVDPGRWVPGRAELSPFPVEAILDNSTTDFDLYLEVAGGLTLYAKAPYKWALEELGRLLGEGHRSLFHLTVDQRKVEAYRRLALSIRIPENLAPDRRIMGLTDAAAELTRVLFEYPLTAASLAQVQAVAAGMVTCIAEDPACVAALGNLSSHDEYTYYHSARVAAYTLAVAMKLSLTDEVQLRELATGALLHDVGKSRIGLGLLHKQGALTKDEWAELKRHPVYGDEVVTDADLGVMPRSVILHHHERFDGSGYPHSLTERELLEEVKIAAFADVFDALTTSRPYQIQRSRYEALDLIRHKLLKNLHKDAFDAMVELLGAAPRER